jgi:hypothetical protein
LRRPPPVVQGYASSAREPEKVAHRLRQCWQAEQRLKSGGDARAELVTLVVALCGR